MRHRLAFGRQLGQEWPQAGRGRWRMAVFVAKAEVEAQPFVVIRALSCRHPSMVQPTLKGRRYIWWNFLHYNVLALTRPLRGALCDCGTEVCGRQAEKPMEVLYSRADLG